MKKKYKLKTSPPDARDMLHPILKTSLISTYASPSILPPIIDLRSEMPPILNQLSLGACALHATSNALRHLLMRENLTVFQPSRLYLYWNTRVNIEGSSANEDTGVCIRDVCKSISKYHACDESYWPYIIEKFNQAPPLIAYQNANTHKQVMYGAIPLDLTQIKTAIYNHYPVIIGIQLFDSFESDAVAKTGIVPIPNFTKEKCLGGHSMLLCGYDDSKSSFLVMNSWGPSWGDHGFCYIPYDYIVNPQLANDYWALSFFK